MSAPSTDWSKPVNTFGSDILYDSATLYDAPVYYEGKYTQLLTNSTDWSPLYGTGIVQTVTPPAIMDDTRYILDDLIVTMDG